MARCRRHRRVGPGRPIHLGRPRLGRFADTGPTRIWQRRRLSGHATSLRTSLRSRSARRRRPPRAWRQTWTSPRRRSRCSNLPETCCFRLSLRPESHCRSPSSCHRHRPHAHPASLARRAHQPVLPTRPVRRSLRRESWSVRPGQTG